jgi:hypothetical protein
MGNFPNVPQPFPQQMPPRPQMPPGSYNFPPPPPPPPGGQGWHPPPPPTGGRGWR